jgi:hypothetical protein
MNKCERIINRTTMLITIDKVLASNKKLEVAVQDPTISPKIRQLLQHWGYTLNVKDVDAYAKKKGLK